jgi:hypothetical protein
MNHIPRLTQQTTPIELFSHTKVAPNLNHKHTFGCPMYILDRRLQAGHKISKWEARSRLAVYIGPSIYHASNIGLGLSLTTGLVSPTFHAIYDDSFTTVNNNVVPYIPKSMWQIKCGFQKETELIHLENQLSLTEISDNPSTITDAPDTIIFERNILETNPSDSIPDRSLHNEPISHEIPPALEGEPTQNHPLPTSTYSTRYGRAVKKPDKDGDFVSYQVHQASSIYEPMTEYTNPITYMSTSDPDTMYYHEILKQSDKKKFSMPCNWKLVTIIRNVIGN